MSTIIFKINLYKIVKIKLYKLFNSAILGTYQTNLIGITTMDNKITFNTAHSRTRVIMEKNPNLKYRVVFSFQLKKAIAEQQKKVTALNADKSVTVAYIAKPKKTVNKKVALVGDYKKPTVKNADLELPFFMMSSILIVFAIAFHTINLL